MINSMKKLLIALLTLSGSYTLTLSIASALANCSYAEDGGYACYTTTDCVKCENGVTVHNQDRNLCPTSHLCYLPPGQQPTSSPAPLTTTKPFASTLPSYNLTDCSYAKNGNFACFTLKECVQCLNGRTKFCVDTANCKGLRCGTAPYDPSQCFKPPPSQTDQPGQGQPPDTPSDPSQPTQPPDPQTPNCSGAGTTYCSPDGKTSIHCWDPNLYGGDGRQESPCGDNGCNTTPGPGYGLCKSPYPGCNYLGEPRSCLDRKTALTCGNSATTLDINFCGYAGSPDKGICDYKTGRCCVGDTGDCGYALGDTGPFAPTDPQLLACYARQPLSLTPGQICFPHSYQRPCTPNLNGHPMLKCAPDGKRWIPDENCVDTPATINYSCVSTPKGACCVKLSAPVAPPPNPPPGGSSPPDPLGETCSADPRNTTCRIGCALQPGQVCEPNSYQEPCAKDGQPMKKCAPDGTSWLADTACKINAGNPLDTNYLCLSLPGQNGSGICCKKGSYNPGEPPQPPPPPTSTGKIAWHSSCDYLNTAKIYSSHLKKVEFLIPPSGVTISCTKSPTYSGETIYSRSGPASILIRCNSASCPGVIIHELSHAKALFDTHGLGEYPSFNQAITCQKINGVYQFKDINKSPLPQNPGLPQSWCAEAYAYGADHYVLCSPGFSTSFPDAYNWYKNHSDSPFKGREFCY